MTNYNQKSTKVICQNCGAEVVIPEHEMQFTGTVIGKNSGLGTIVMPTVSHNCGTNKGFPQESSRSITEIAALIRRIEDEGYIDVKNIVRRWVESQALMMLNSEAGFHATLVNYGVSYSWKVLANDLNAQVKMRKAKDWEAWEDRNRWYNKNIAVKMAQDYVAKLRALTKLLPWHKCKGKPYIELNCNLNNGRGVFADEVSLLLEKFEMMKSKIERSCTAFELYNAVADFGNGVRLIREPILVSDAFVNAYKAVGGYYTIKHFIKFEGYLLKKTADGTTDTRPRPRTFADQLESLRLLEQKAENVVSRGVERYGYEMLGLLKEFLDYNDFDYSAIKKKWAEQSEARRVVRSFVNNRRPRK